VAQSALTALVGQRVYHKLPAAPLWPLVVVSKVDDAELQWHTSTLRMQCDVWGDGNSAAAEANVDLIARTLVSVMRDLRGAWTSGRISNVGHANTIPSPDPDTGRARQIVDLFIELNPT
jgi:hypothetical protein